MDGNEKEYKDMIQYKENPFYLTEEQVQWVESTYDSMNLEEKI